MLCWLWAVQFVRAYRTYLYCTSRLFTDMWNPLKLGYLPLIYWFQCESNSTRNSYFVCILVLGRYDDWCIVWPQTSQRIVAHSSYTIVTHFQYEESWPKLQNNGTTTDRIHWIYVVVVVVVVALSRIQSKYRMHRHISTHTHTNTGKFFKNTL